jgi:hypothetical protein
MKAFLAGLAIALLIAVGTAVVFGVYGISAQDYFSTPEVRLSS